MRHQILNVVMVLGVLGSVSQAFGEEAADRGADRAVYNQLVEKVRQIDREYGQALADGVKEARERDGKAPLETQSRLLTLQEKRDRAMTRLTLVALRHGWTIPEQNASATSDPGPHSVTDRIFEPAAEIIRSQFAAESRRIAASVRLPLISVPGMEADRK